MEFFDLIIIGSGITGLSAAKAFAETSGNKKILILNGEDRLPYKRTEITKNIEKGFSKEEFSLFEKYKDYGFWVQAKAAVIDYQHRTLSLTNKKEYTWKTLILATGATAKKVYNPKSHVIRTALDGESLLQKARGSRSAAIIGGGVLAVETAVQLRNLGLAVNIYLQKSRLLEDSFTPFMSDHLDTLLRSEKIKIEYNHTINQVDDSAQGFTIRSSSENRLFDLVTECAGSIPNTELCGKDMIRVNKGIVVDSFMQTSYKGVFAAGDCTEFLGIDVCKLWHQAEDQGLQAGKNAALFLQGKPMEEFPDRKRRMKLEVFGQYYYSQNYSSNTEYDKSIKSHKNNIYEEFHFKNNILSAITMTGNKTRAKEYEQALWKNWPITKLKETFLS
ncbi:MAG: FAD-dependent oxidoreductase [Spirochaetales bacterium]|nr:FAD-dependent oxidoreductase [Spirochaetales bacterium]